MKQEKLYAQAKENLLMLGYAENVVTTIISTIKEDPHLIPYDNHGKIKFIDPSDAFTMIDNKEAVKQFLSKFENEDTMIYMLLPCAFIDFQYLHSFLVTKIRHCEDEDSREIIPYTQEGQENFARALVFNSSVYEHSEYGDVLTRMTKKGLERVA